MVNEYIERIERFLENHEVTDFYFEQRARHFQVKGTLNGRRFCATFPKTGSDWRGPLNVVSDLRHAMGLVGNDNVKSMPRKRIKKHKAANRTKPAFAPPIAERAIYVDRFYTRLQIIRERVVAATAERQPGNVTIAPAEVSTIELCRIAKPNGRIRLLTPWLGKRARFSRGVQ